MLPEDALQLDHNPAWRTLLEGYLLRQTSVPDGWVDRLTDLGNYEDGELSKIHGSLIAMNLLDFDVSPKGTGVRYQVTTLGRGALLKLAAAPAEEEVSSADAA
ncbi:MAG: hypothetical protein U0903_16045 [Planctomycetales bacterium]